jgi:hypothetical protein
LSVQGGSLDGKPDSGAEVHRGDAAKLRRQVVGVVNGHTTEGITATVQALALMRLRLIRLADMIILMPRVRGRLLGGYRMKLIMCAASNQPEGE